MPRATRTAPREVPLSEAGRRLAALVKWLEDLPAGRIALTVRKPGEPVPTAPPPGELPGPAAEGKRDDFIRAAMNFLGCSYRKGGRKPADGIDGAGLVAICLKRIGLLKENDPELEGPDLWAMFNHLGGEVGSPPAEVVPGDLAWFGEGDHYTDAQQHPMVYLGGGRLLGPVPSGPTRRR